MVLGVVVAIMLWYAPRPYIFFFFLDFISLFDRT